jgi:hypothetical protein
LEKETQMVLNNRLRQWLGRIPRNHATSARRRRTRRQAAILAPPADVLEVLENRLLLSADFLRFAVQPSNGIAGHAFKSFTVDVMHTVRFKGAPITVVDRSYDGWFTVTANGPGVLVASTVPPAPGNIPPGTPLTFDFTTIHKGVGTYLASFDILALDVAGTYTLTVTSPAGTGPGYPTVPVNPGVPGNAVSNPFNISVDTASDHLVFVNLPSTVLAGDPFSATVAVEDQFGNIDKTISNVPVYLGTTGGNTYMTQLSAGQATFTGVTLPAAPPNLDPFSQEFMGALGFGGPNGFVFGSTFITVVSPNSGG